MQCVSKSNAVAPTSAKPFAVVDLTVLARVAGGAGPHGGWAVPTPETVLGAMRNGAGPHGGWRVAPAGPHGGW